MCNQYQRLHIVTTELIDFQNLMKLKELIVALLFNDFVFKPFIATDILKHLLASLQNSTQKIKLFIVLKKILKM